MKSVISIPITSAEADVLYEALVDYVQQIEEYRQFVFSGNYTDLWDEYDENELKSAYSVLHKLDGEYYG